MRSWASRLTLPAEGSSRPARIFMKVDLPAAVGADQAVAVAFAELDGDVLEQGLGPELHGDVGRDEHWEILCWGGTPLEFRP